jgi:hypothetical protein
LIKNKRYYFVEILSYEIIFHGHFLNMLLYRIKRYITKLKEVSNLKTFFVHVFIKISIVNWIKKINISVGYFTKEINLNLFLHLLWGMYIKNILKSNVLIFILQNVQFDSINPNITQNCRHYTKVFKIHVDIELFQYSK